MSGIAVIPLWVILAVFFVAPSAPMTLFSKARPLAALFASLAARALDPRGAAMHVTLKHRIGIWVIATLLSASLGVYSQEETPEDLRVE